jgi:hypothetical protein
MIGFKKAKESKIFFKEVVTELLISLCLLLKEGGLAT